MLFNNFLSIIAGTKKNHLLKPTTPYPEEDLLQDLRNGSVEAFEYIFKTYWHSLYVVADNKLHSRAEAEEVVQELFTTLWEKRGTLLITNLSFYLFTSVRNRVVNKIRDKVLQEKYWKFYQRPIPQRTGATDELVELNDLQNAMKKVMNTMPDKSKTIFTLNKLEGKSVPEIARQLKLSEKAIEYHLTKSLKTLRANLRKFIISIAMTLTILH